LGSREYAPLLPTPYSPTPKLMHYLRLIYTFTRLGVLNEFQYRANFGINLVQSLLTVGMSLGGLAVVFQHTDALAGWLPMELVALVGIYYVMAGVIGAVIQPSMELFLQDVRQGTLDFVLTKPEDSQLLVSIRRVSIWGFITILLGGLVLGVALVQLAEAITLAQFGAFASALGAGIVIVYSFWLILATLAFWFIKIENILVIFDSMYQAGRWPVNIYPPFLRAILTFLVPIAFAVTVPAEAAVGRLSPVTLVGAVSLAVAIFAAARWFWFFGIRHYSGASA
jgi:ABC-2 type transport system permease protein